MLGKYDYGDGRKKRRPELHDLQRSATATTRSPSTRTWWLTQFRRWGMVDGAPDYEGVAKQVMRGDLYEEAMKEIGYAHGGADDDAGDAVRRQDVRPGQARRVRDELRGQQHEGMKSDAST